MDARLSPEQRDLRAAAARLADSLGPQSVHDLTDEGDGRLARLEKAVAATGWRTLRSDGASGVELAIVAEEFARGLVDVPYLGPALADALQASTEPTTIAVDGVAVDARGIAQALVLSGISVSAARAADVIAGVDLTRVSKELIGPLEQVGVISAERASRWQALALVATTADLLGAARGAHALACDYAKVRAQYGHKIGSYQAVSHPLAEGLALIEGSVSILRYAAWAVDETKPEDAIRAARLAKVYCAKAARTVCETSIQVHGGIGNTWDCLAHVYLRRVLAATELFPVRLEEVDCGLS
ncbi:MAG TPA: acyl-CoA dehydrogenase family protein [Trebonia sp.]|nr:acyl-CoA dehydrogenase family protein [Trebonia sp.]